MSLLTQLGDWANKGLDLMQEIVNHLQDTNDLLQDILEAVEDHSYQYHSPKKEKKK